MQIDPTMPIMMRGFSGSGPEPKPGAPAEVHIAERRPHPDVHVGNSADAEQADRTLRELSQALEPFNISLKFTKDEETGTIVIQMIDVKSGDTLSQIPNAASLHVAATLAKLQGQLFNTKA